MTAKQVRHFFLIPSLVAALILPLTARGETVLPDHFHAIYVMKLGSLELASMTRSLEHNGDRYIFKSHSKPIGYARWLTDDTLTEYSIWTYHEETLRPLYYRNHRAGDKPEDVELDFDWLTMQAVNSVEPDPWKVGITDQTLDKLLYHLAVMRDLLQGENSFEYEVVDDGELKIMRFEFLKEETIKTAFGELETVKMLHPGKRKENDTILWFAKALGYIPVRIEQEKKAGTVTITLESVEGIPRRPQTAENETN